MIVILQSLAAKSVLARPQERLLAKTNAHYITLLWVGAALLAIPAILLGTVLVAGIFDADYIYFIGVLITLPLLWFAINYATFPFREIVVTDRSIYRIRWGRVGLGWGIARLTEIPIESIVSAVPRQSFLTRMLGYGQISLRLNVPPQDLKLRYIPYPLQFAGVIQRAVMQRSQLLPITDADVQNTRIELQSLYDRQIITYEQLELATNDLTHHTAWLYYREPAPTVINAEPVAEQAEPEAVPQEISPEATGTETEPPEQTHGIIDSTAETPDQTPASSDAAAETEP